MRLLLFVVGVGAGNTTRNLAILDELKRQAPDLDIHVAAQGKARELLEKFFPVHALREITYASGGEFSFWNIVSSNLAFPLRFLENRRASAELIRRLAPDVVLADSDFYCLGPAKKMRVPLASINNSAAIVAFFREKGIPKDCGFSARFIERTDDWLQRRYPDRVICPVLRPVDGLDKKFVQIPPIVRPGFEPSDDEGDSVVVVTGGSGIGVQDIDLRGVKYPIVTYGSRIDRLPGHAKQLGFTLEDIGPMRRARVVVVQGGFSSVSEAVALRRPTVVVPIARHAEQHVNAALVEEMGLGLAAEGPDAGRKVNEVLERHAEFAARCRASRLPTDGAAHAARALLEMM